MTGRSDRAVWAVAIGLLVGIALVGGLIMEGWRDENRRVPTPTAQFLMVALA